MKHYLVLIPRIQQRMQQRCAHHNGPPQAQTTLNNNVAVANQSHRFVETSSMAFATEEKSAASSTQHCNKMQALAVILSGALPLLTQPRSVEREGGAHNHSFGNPHHSQLGLHPSQPTTLQQRSLKRRRYHHRHRQLHGPSSTSMRQR